jgi:hypothetical protein
MISSMNFNRDYLVSKGGLHCYGRALAYAIEAREAKRRASNPDDFKFYRTTLRSWGTSVTHWRKTNLFWSTKD